MDSACVPSPNRSSCLLFHRTCQRASCMQYQQCPLPLVAALHNAALYRRSPSGVPMYLQRLPPYLLADLATAVADLHTHCGHDLAKAPQVVSVTQQIVANAICAPPCHPCIRLCVGHVVCLSSPACAVQLLAVLFLPVQPIPDDTTLKSTRC
jgi:hypothetical protein